MDFEKFNHYGRSLIVSQGSFCTVSLENEHVLYSRVSPLQTIIIQEPGSDLEKEINEMMESGKLKVGAEANAFIISEHNDETAFYSKDKVFSSYAVQFLKVKNLKESGEYKV